MGFFPGLFSGALRAAASPFDIRVCHTFHDVLFDLEEGRLRFHRLTRTFRFGAEPVYLLGTAPYFEERDVVKRFGFCPPLA